MTLSKYSSTGILHTTMHKIGELPSSQSTLANTHLWQYPMNEASHLSNSVSFGPRTLVLPSLSGAFVPGTYGSFRLQSLGLYAFSLEF